MSRKAKARSSRASGNPISGFKAFKRLVHAKGNLRQGIKGVRAMVSPSQMPEIVREAMAFPLYAVAIAGEPFPKSMNDFKMRPRLSQVAPAREFMWTASVVGAFSEMLARFVPLRAAYETHLLNGDNELAISTLDSIEERFGVSIWLIGNRLQLLQMEYGLSEQKAYLQEIISVKGISPSAAFLAFFASIRSEENITIAALEQQAADLLASPLLRDYAVHHLFPFNTSLIDDPSSPVYWEETQPIIDRYQALVAMLRLQCVRDDSAPYLLPALTLLNEVNDPQVERLVSLLDRLHRTHIASAPRSDCAILCDAYTDGKYDHVFATISDHVGSRAPDTLELAARASCFISNAGGNSDQGVSSRIISGMRDILLASEHYQKSAQDLRKLALNCGAQTTALHIMAFLNRQHSFVDAEEYTELDALSAIAGQLDNPWHAELLCRLTGDENYLERLTIANPASSSLNLRRIIRMSLPDATVALKQLCLPSHRETLYLGHVCLRNREFNDAIAHYEAAATSSYALTATTAKKYLFKARFSIGALRECLELVADHYLQSPTSYRLYPVDKLLEAIFAAAELRGEITVAIVAYIAARHFNPMFERHLSDAYESFLEENDVERPTELRTLSHLSHDNKFIFFLRYVCVQELLDDSIVFRSVQDVESERIALCQQLIELDPDTAESYAGEIRTITREIEIAARLRTVEESKIYVGETGIRAVVDDLLKDEYRRWRAFTDIPELTYRAEEITKRLEELLKEKSPEMKQFRLPVSEKESLFSEMWSLFVNEFAANPAYGLDTHLSTSIRHGAFEGHMRRPMAARGLLNLRDPSTQQYLSNDHWMAHYEDLGEADLEHINRALTRFSQKVDRVVDNMKDNLLQLESATHKSGLFRFGLRHTELGELMKQSESATDYEEFVDGLFDAAWSCVDRSLRAVQEELRGPLQETVNRAFEALVSTIEDQVPHSRVRGLIGEIASARTEFQSTVDKVSRWFQLADVLKNEPFRLDIAIGVALKEIENCYSKQHFTPKLDIRVPFQISGHFFDGFVELLFILLQNALRHSGISYPGHEIEIAARDVAGTMTIAVTNDLSPTPSLDERREIAREAMSRYEHDTAMRMARREGGSGLSKVWRILEFVFKVEHRLSLEVTDDYRFLATVSFPSAELRQC